MASCLLTPRSLNAISNEQATPERFTCRRVVERAQPFLDHITRKIAIMPMRR